MMEKEDEIYAALPRARKKLTLIECTAYFIGLMALMVLLIGFCKLCTYKSTTIVDDGPHILNVATAILTGFGSFIFFSVYYNIQVKGRDPGLLFWSAALLAWGVHAVIKLSYPDIRPIPVLQEIISTINNYCIIAALAYFDHGGPNFSNKTWIWILSTNERFSNYSIPLPKSIKTSTNVLYSKNILDKYRKRFCLIFLGIALIICFLLYFIEGEIYKAYIDGTASGLTILAFGIGLFKGFQKRKLLHFAALSVVVPIVMFGIVGAYLSNLTGLITFDDFETKLAIAILVFKIIIIFMMASLSISWMHEFRTEKWILQRDEMVHLVNNCLTHYYMELAKQKRSLESENAILTQDFLTDNIARVASLRALFDLDHKYFHSVNKTVRLLDYLEDICSLLKEFYKFEKEKFSFKSGKANLDDEVLADSARDIARILTELVINAYKYGKKTAKIDIRTENGDLIIAVADEGTGYDKTKVKEGFGTKVINKYLESLEGIIFEDPNYKNGTKRIVTIPIKKITHAHENPNIGG